MIRSSILLGTVIGLLATILTAPSLAQMQRPQRRFGPPRRERPSREDHLKRIEQAKAQAQIQAIKEALEVTETQWRMIWPRLKKVQELHKQANIAATIKNAAWVTTSITTRKRGEKPVTEKDRKLQDWDYRRSWEDKAGLSRAEKACDALIALLKSDNATDQQKKEAMDELRRAKAEAAKQLAVAQQELREVLSFRQEAILFMMGWLE